MQSEAAILWEVGREWSVEPIELDPPGTDEVLVELRAAGLCHTDDHFPKGDMAWPLPTIGGHEGAGVVTGIGPGVTRVAVGDHVVLNYMPICGSCPSCMSGRSRLCDRGAAMGTGMQVAEPVQLAGQPVQPSTPSQQLAVFGRPSRFQQGPQPDPIEPSYWDLSHDALADSRSTWIEPPNDPDWEPTSALGPDQLANHESTWVKPPNDPTWVPQSGFRN